MTARPAAGAGAPPSFRLVTLDVIRGAAVMGILVANMPGFALPHAAYFSPLAWGGTGPAELAAWLATFVLIEGKMRGLFSLLFGASMLLILDRARAAGRNPAAVHLRRMAALLLFGLAHLYLIWWGDILAHYALVGTIALPFARLPAERLLALGLAVLAATLAWNALAWSALLDSAARDTPQAVATWDSFARSFGVPPRAVIIEEVAAIRGPLLEAARWRWEQGMGPLAGLKAFGPETLSAMLLGMAAYRSGFLTGAWERARYRRWALICLGIALPAYLLLGLHTMWRGFDQRWVFFASIVASVPLRTLAFTGYAALIVLLVNPGGRLTQRIAAAGRAAFTNYLGTSLLVTGLFSGWGLGLFGSLSRAQLYVVVPIVWLLMLAWSKPWLERWRYGPFEWAWRSLAEGRPAPMRTQTPSLSGRAPG